LIRYRFVAIAAKLPALSPALATADSGGVSDEWVMTTVRKHRAMCHSENPSHTMILGRPPPKGVVLESIEDVRLFAPGFMEMVARGMLMPFSNEAATTEAGRVKLVSGLRVHDGRVPLSAFSRQLAGT
jgi:uncharacterized membrane protein